MLGSDYVSSLLHAPRAVLCLRSVPLTLPLPPKVLLVAFEKSWKQTKDSQWSDRSGVQLQRMVKNAQEFEKKLGAKIMEKIAKAKVEE